MTYQRLDHELVDYQPYQFGDLRQTFRGPRPTVTSKSYVSCIGAAQTWGRFVKHPFPELLEQLLGITCWNLGTGGAGPEYFLGDRKVIDAINASRLCIAQVLSGRSVSNRYYAINPLRNARLRVLDRDLAKTLRVQVDSELFAFQFFQKMKRAAVDDQLMESLARDLRQNWVTQMLRLLDAIQVPKVLFWFSQREPDEHTSFSDRTVLDHFPQFIDGATLDQIKGKVDRFVKVVSCRGVPQLLVKNGEPVIKNGSGEFLRENKYYPSPEMHEDAAAALYPELKKMLFA